MTRRVTLLLLTAVGVVVAAVAAVTVLVVVNYDGRSAAAVSALPGLPGSTGCVKRVALYFPTDEEMEDVATALRNDTQVRSVKRMTKAENYERFKEIFADQPELVELARLEAMPASAEVSPVRGVDAEDLADRFRRDLPQSDVSVLPCWPR
jgi:FtsX-like permease family protein